MNRIDYNLLFFCNLNNPLSPPPPKKFTGPSGKLGTDFTSPIAKPTSPGLSDTTFFAHCNKLPELHFEFPFNLISKLTMAFLTGLKCGVLKSWYTGGDPEQGFQHYFADGLNQKLRKLSVCGIGYQTPISWSKMRLSSFRQAELQCVWVWVAFYGNDDLISNPASWVIEINVSFLFSSWIIDEFEKET